MEGAILAESSNPEKVIKLTLGEFTIGRSLKCSYVVEDLNVSRQHCEIQCIDNKWCVMDQSSNGTFLNGQLLEKDTKYDLKDGDVISLNDRCKYTFKVGNKETTTDTPTTLKNTLSEDEIIDIAETVTECAAEFNQNFTSSSHEEASLESTSSSQGEKRKKRKSKRKLKNEENVEDFEDVGEPKEKVIKSEVKLTEEDDELQCSVCTELFIKAVTLTCSHTFCKYCIDQWRKTRADCPICRAKINSVSPTLIIDNLIEKVIDKCSDEVKQRRIKIVEERTAAADDAEKKSIVIDSEASDEDEDNELYEDDDVYWDYSSVNGWSDDDDEEDEEYITIGDGPGPYYGGYGRCYICNQQGHWANGCPSRARRF